MQKRIKVVLALVVFSAVGVAIKTIEAKYGFKYHPDNPPETAISIPGFLAFALGPYTALTFPTNLGLLIYFAISSALPLFCFFKMFNQRVMHKLALSVFGALLWVLGSTVLLMATFGS